MPRVAPLITINVNVHFLRRTWKIEVLPTPWAGRYRVRLNRRNSSKFNDGTVSDISVLLRKMLSGLLRAKKGEGR